MVFNWTIISVNGNFKNKGIMKQKTKSPHMFKYLSNDLIKEIVEYC